MITRLLIPAIFLLPASGHAQEHFQPGVYDLRICGPSCASGSTIAQGTLILLAAPVRDASGAPLIVGIPQPVNGCFRFARYQPHGMIGHKEGGYLIWSQAQGRLFLNFSPDGVDAGYSIEFSLVSGELKGKGVTWYASEPNPPPPPPDAVIARRTGPAAPAQCAPSVVEPLRSGPLLSPQTPVAIPAMR